MRTRSYLPLKATSSPWWAKRSSSSLLHHHRGLMATIRACKQLKWMRQRGHTSLQANSIWSNKIAWDSFQASSRSVDRLASSRYRQRWLRPHTTNQSLLLFASQIIACHPLLQLCRTSAILRKGIKIWVTRSWLDRGTWPLGTIVA